MNRKVFIAVAVGIVAYSLTEAVKDHKEAKRERAEIVSNAAKEIEAIRLAAAVIVDRIRAGQYDNNFGAIENDYQFLKIAHLES